MSTRDQILEPLVLQDSAEHLRPRNKSQASPLEVHALVPIRQTQDRRDRQHVDPAAQLRFAHEAQPLQLVPVGGDQQVMHRHGLIVPFFVAPLQQLF